MTTQPEESIPGSPLDTLAEKFSQWRASRASRRTAVPTSLRQQAIELLKDYRKSHVIKALGINNTMLKNWQEQKAESSASGTFVSLNVATPAEEPALALTLINAQGATLQIKGNFSLPQLTAFAQGLCSAQTQEEPSV